MDSERIIKDLSGKFEASLGHFQGEIGKLRTGRANPSVLDKVSVTAYGVSLPLKQLANISAPEAQLLQITPFDSTNLQAISSAIRDDQSLGLNPADDGIVIRIQVPALTTERRAEIVKQLNQKTEESMIGMRSSRHEAIKELDEAKRQKSVGDDEHARSVKHIDTLMGEYKTKIEDISKAKEKEIMTI